MKRCNNVHQHVSQQKEVKHHIECRYLVGNAPIHDFYRDHFNLIDLHDRYWYRAQDSHHNHSWKSKLLLGNMKIAMINAWVACELVHHKPYLDFRKHVAVEMLKY